MSDADMRREPGEDARGVARANNLLDLGAGEVDAAVERYEAVAVLNNLQRL